MGSFSPLQLAIIVLVLLSVIPAWRILHRLGISPAWLLVCVIPIGIFVGLWLLAFARWPKVAAVQPGSDPKSDASAGERPPPSPLPR